MSTNRPSGGARGRDHHVRQRRDAALDRTRSITKTVGVASLAAVAAFGIYLSRALPGHAATSTGTTTTGSTGSGSTSVNQSNGGATSGSPTQLAPPSSPPAQSQSQAPVVSGSS